MSKIKLSKIWRTILEVRGVIPSGLSFKKILVAVSTLVALITTPFVVGNADTVNGVDVPDNGLTSHDQALWSDNGR